MKFAPQCEAIEFCQIGLLLSKITDSFLLSKNYYYYYYYYYCYSFI